MKIFFKALSILFVILFSCPVEAGTKELRRASADLKVLEKPGSKVSLPLDKQHEPRASARGSIAVLARGVAAATRHGQVAPDRASLDGLSEKEIQQVKGLIASLDPLIKERDKKQNLATLTFEELYAPLDKDQRSFLKKFEKLDAKELHVRIPFRGMATGKEELLLITGQKVKVRDKKKQGTDKDIRELSAQFLPPNVYRQYLAMMEAMQKDIGRKLLVESGYRSSAYQLYLFVFYLQNHEYSIRETVKFVALPGYSEHGSPQHQAIDFINPDGINGEDHPEEFQALPEYGWLLKNAKQFGFVLSYPRTAGKGITFEPWHWRFEETQINAGLKRTQIVADKKKTQMDAERKGADQRRFEKNADVRR